MVAAMSFRRLKTSMPQTKIPRVEFPGALPVFPGVSPLEDETLTESNPQTRRTSARARENGRGVASGGSLAASGGLGRRREVRRAERRGRDVKQDVLRSSEP